MKALSNPATIVSIAAYPMTMTIMIALHRGMQSFGIPVFFSSYTPVVLAALLIVWMEWRMPEQNRWRPARSDLQTDSLYLLLMQFLLPQLFTFVVILTLASSRPITLPEFMLIWPQHWPILGQAALLLLLADFSAYIYHRAAHSNRWLWRLHAVHHSPDKLYWLNVSRFHPLEKLLQLLLTRLPFILLGVTAPVFALYLVFYSINGFFQHCNIRLRFGPLNYLISSAELHRWHHSRNQVISAHNFGNNLSVWDLLFGSWFLPKGRQPKRLGLQDRYYPQQFNRQMGAPFRTSAPGEETSTKTTLSLLLCKIAMSIVRRNYWCPLVAASRHPQRSQKQALKRIIDNNRRSGYGLEHGFNKINDYRDFAASIPIQDYESLRPYIDRQQLTVEAPIMYALTSGSAGQPKTVPVLKSTIDQYRRQQALFAYLQFRSRPSAFAGKTLALVSPATEGHLENGFAYGSVTGHIYRSMPAVFRKRYLIPAEIFSISDYRLKYKIIARIALAEPDITCLAAANPSSFLRLIDVINDHSQELIDSVASGRMQLPDSLTRKTRLSIQQSLTADRNRAERLTRLDAQGKLRYRDLWPTIRTLNTWTGGSCGIALARLQRQLPDACVIRELGYVATEFRVTLPIPEQANAGLPLIDRHFFEFVKVGDWEAGRKNTVLIDQLQDGEEYYIIVTADNGLYRYFINDIVRVEGFFNRTPLLNFIRKGLGVTNITGEKLYENQLIDAVTAAAENTHIQIVFYLMLADPERASYCLYIETGANELADAEGLASLIDRHLCADNIEYQHKRQSGRLAPLHVCCLQQGSGEAFKQFYLRQGQREAQFKPKVLQYRDDCRFAIRQYCLAPETDKEAV